MEYRLATESPMIMLFLGIALIAVGAVFDSFFRMRMKRSGHKWALLEGGAFDYRKYHAERKKRGWAAWPVYLMWASIVAGIALLILGFFTFFGTAPTRPR